MNGWGHIALIAAVAAGVTVFLRAVPFLLFRPGKPLPPAVAYVSRMLSPAIIAMLVVYCFGCYARDRIPSEHEYGLAELAAAVVVVGLQLWKRNPLVSILCGTAVYMVMVQLVLP